MARISRREWPQGAGAMAEVIFGLQAGAGVGVRNKAMMRRSEVEAQRTNASGGELSYAGEQESQ